jgi:hypothetical protein
MHQADSGEARGGIHPRGQGEKARSATLILIKQLIHPLRFARSSTQAKTNFIDKFLDNPESTPVYLVLFSNPDVLLIMRRPHNKQELVHYIPPESSPLNVSRIWLVQQSLHLQTLQLSLPSSQTQTFTLTSPLSSTHITPSLSQSVSSVLNRSSDSSTSSLTWSEVSTNEQKVQPTDIYNPGH